MRNALGIGMAAALSLIAARALGEDRSTDGVVDPGSAIAPEEKTAGGGSGEPQRAAAVKTGAGGDAAARARAEGDEALREEAAHREFVERIWTGP